jgi:hypothetical protein
MFLSSLYYYIDVFAAHTNFALAGLGNKIASRQGAKNAKFGVVFFLCGLCAFAGDTPSFGCGYAARCRPVYLRPETLKSPQGLVYFERTDVLNCLNGLNDLNSHMAG